MPALPPKKTSNVADLVAVAYAEDRDSKVEHFLVKRLRNNTPQCEQCAQSVATKIVGWCASEGG
eukprot:34296-Rhodomonas_salina.1